MLLQKVKVRSVIGLVWHIVRYNWSVYSFHCPSGHEAGLIARTIFDEIAL